MNIDWQMVLIIMTIIALWVAVFAIAAYLYHPQNTQEGGQDTMSVCQYIEPETDYQTLRYNAACAMKNGSINKAGYCETHPMNST